MDITEKMKILADSAKYDVSCSSSGSNRKNEGGIGNGHSCGICHSWSDDGRCISLLKVLFTNKCIYDCAYCLNRRSNDIPRAEFTPDELADLTIEFYRRNYIEGLFLSSAIIKNPDYTMELMINVLKLLRQKYRFFGYIHVKVIPGASEQLVQSIGNLADRISVNIELPTEQSLNVLAPQKTKKAIITPMKYISNTRDIIVHERKKSKNIPKFVPAGQTTQMIVGATADSDLQIMKLTQGLYDKFSLKRVYYSAYVPVGTHPSLPTLLQKPPLLREHRLYQADWLLRFYGFRADEILDEFNPNLSAELDPKCAWAVRNPHLFPVDVNSAPYEMLLRVPGIGVLSAKRIMTARKHTRLTYDNLKKIGVVLKRAKYFIITYGEWKDSNLLQFSPASVTTKLLEKQPFEFEQLSFFDNINPVSLSLIGG